MSISLQHSATGQVKTLPERLELVVLLRRDVSRPPALQARPYSMGLGDAGPRYRDPDRKLDRHR